ncbi:MAG: DUF4388 domain-containing protein [Candidatus Eremiobacterota bacterium]
MTLIPVILYPINPGREGVLSYYFMNLSNQTSEYITKEFDLSETGTELIIDLLNKQKLTGLLTIEDDREKGEIYLHDGNIIYAKLGNLEGERAILSFIAWVNGRGKFIDSRSSEKFNKNTTYETPFLIETMNKELAEISKMKDLIYSLDLVFEVINTGKPMYIKTAELTVLPWVDGKTSIREIGQVMGREYTGVIKSIYKLYKENIICKR